ncbi:tripartite tricarboxylate transporter TctB family protein [Paracoccus sp. 1_MG-2023]|uniref:tripartite tricarboxylate transporter TctB family protein n=1 Tax=unclassified Paracoccus (in: a-proteobacteria) TaxID=2688777 RepID=UPI001C09E794|nr:MULTISPECIES: tripartite tricarboxylate transporter TctB family protein [unclassified Paracoccus (in: a-proteobacteria)]MBU2959134.1 tripartite tricarboxylate transporter TctB family protein [Paracoccus sp. C2R09]MDO6669418.1 tripartite tricarboxylate transporter TctB family protein [Paracoccus sp. 1_MG-2023]
MTWRSLNILISTVLVLGGASYAVAINRSASDAIFFSSAGIGPAYFPNILAVLLVALSVITLVKNLRDPSPELASKVTTVNSIYIVATLVLAAAAIAAWQFTGYFYPVVFILLALLIAIFRAEFGAMRSLGVGVVTSAATTLFIYALFGRILQISF